MPERTEMQKILMTPVKVMLGDKEYEIRPLPIKLSNNWREKVIKFLATVPEYASVTSDKPEEFQRAISNILGMAPKTTQDLFFEYAKDLNRELIEDTASAAQIEAAFEVCLDFERPLLAGLTKALMLVSR